MIVILIALFTAVVIVIRPISLAYMLLLYMLINGVVSRAAAESFRLTVGSINISILDYFFGMMILLLFIGLILRKPIKTSREVRVGTLLVALFMAYHISRFLIGFYQVPTDALIRFLYSDFQAVYYFLPLMFVRNEKQLRYLLVALVCFSLIYPFAQILFASREEAIMSLQGAGNYRLGFGDTAIPVGAGLLALYLWERRLWLMGLPAVSIILLAHRSAYISIFITLIMAAKYKGEKIKVIGVIIFGGLLTGISLLALQHFSGEALLDNSINRLSNTFEPTGTTVARQKAIPFMLGKWTENPILGLSYKSLYKLRESIRESTISREGGGQYKNAGNFLILHPHNFITRALVHYGLVGFILLFLIIGYSLLTAKKLIKHKKFKKVGIFLLTSQVYFLIYAAMNTTMGSAGFFYWILVGCTFWYIGQARTLDAASALSLNRSPEQGRGLLLSKKGRLK